MFSESKFYIYNGVDGKYINIYNTENKDNYLIEYNNEKYIHNTNYRQKKMSYGEFGCFLSHVKLFQFMIEMKIPKLFICEDDILPKFNDNNIFNEYVKNLPSNFDVALFHHKSEKFQNEVISIGNYYFQFKPNVHPKFTQALSYIISYEGAIKFLTRNKSNINLPLDDQLSRLNLNIIYSKDVLFEQNPEIIKSSIWNIYKDNEKDDNVKWDKEIIKGDIKNELTEFIFN